MVEVTNTRTLLPEATEPTPTSAPHAKNLPKMQKAIRALFALAAMTVIPDVRAQESSKTDGPQVVAQKSGTLVIVGGGPSPEADEAFVELAGESAKIVLIPSASARADGMAEITKNMPMQDIAHFWKPPKNPLSLDVLNTRSRTKADEEGFAQVLRSANGVWFSGGDQGCLSDTFRDTLVHRELQALLDRGGVIGGTSAGASVAGKNMIRRDEMIDGKIIPVLDQGFGFLDKTFCEHHFLRPRRRERVEVARQKFSDHSVVALEEGMAITVPLRTRIATVIGGSSKAHYFPSAFSQKTPVSLSAGDRINLLTDDIEYAEGHTPSSTATGGSR